VTFNTSHVTNEQWGEKGKKTNYRPISADEVQIHLHHTKDIIELYRTFHETPSDTSKKYNSYSWWFAFIHTILKTSSNSIGHLTKHHPIPLIQLLMIHIHSANTLIKKKQFYFRLNKTTLQPNCISDWLRIENLKRIHWQSFRQILMVRWCSPIS